MTITAAANLLGFIGTATAMIMFVPTAVAVWKNRHDVHALRSAPLWQPVAIIANSLVWAVYAVITKAYWSGAMGLVHIPIALFTGWCIVRARSRAARAEGDHAVVADAVMQ